MPTTVTKLDIKHSTAFLRDRFVPFADANLSIGSSPVLYGLSVYTTASANWDADSGQLYLFRLRDHYQRLADSCQIMGFPPLTEAYPYAKFEQLVQALLQRNHVRQDSLVRISVFIDELLAGTRIHGLKAALSMYVYPLGELLPRTGIHVGISSWTKPGDNAIPPRAKVNGAYAAAALIKNEALLNGFDDAIILDQSGHVSESTVANVFMVRHGRLITPHDTSDVLEGITRRSVFDIAQHLDLPCEAANIDRTQLYTTDELFLCGSSAVITPILSVDHRRIGNGRFGPITTGLANFYTAIQHGQQPEFRHLLTSVY